MQTSSNLNVGENSYPAFDTSFILFFLAFDLGQGLNSFSFDTFFIGITVLMVAVLPYFLTSQETFFGKWLIGRSFITGFALMLGIIFNISIGAVLPETLRFLPLTLLILAAMIGCYIQFYSFFRLRSSN